MAKLTKSDRSELRAVLADWERARDYLMWDRMAVCMVRPAATTTEDYTRAKDGRVLCEVVKDYGSDLCRLEAAINRLSSFLVHH